MFTDRNNHSLVVSDGKFHEIFSSVQNLIGSFEKCHKCEILKRRLWTSFFADNVENK